jgi:hypothetical protein
VLERASGRPLARARVELKALKTGPSLSTLTDNRGQFVFAELPAGAYTLTAAKVGFESARFGQSRPGAAGAVIAVDDRASFWAQLALPRRGAISGHVVDDNDVGLPGVQVQAWRLTHSGLRPAGFAITDDRGQFRIGGLAAGRYLVRTEARQLEDGLSLLPTLPGGVQPAQATPIVLDLDQEIQGVTIQPRPGTLSALRGRIVNLPGPRGRVLLAGDLGVRELEITPDGQFYAAALAPGEYTLVLDAPGLASALQTVTLSAPEEHVVLQAQRPSELGIECQHLKMPAASPAASVFLRRILPFAQNLESASCGQTLSLTPGDWEVVAAAPAGLYLAELSGARRVGAHYRLTIRPAETTSIGLRFSAPAASLTGQVRTSLGIPAVGAPVWIRALDDELAARLGGPLTAQADHQGRYRFPQLPPGRYQLLASFDIGEESTVWPEALEIELQEGSEIHQDLTLAAHGSS